MQQNNVQYRPRKNYQIKASQVRLISNDGTNIGVVSIQEALQKAKEAGLDLVEINSKSTPIVAKIVDYGKMLYEEKKKAQATKKNQQIQELKEISCRPNTDEADFQRLISQARQFLTDKDRVRFSIKFRGRELSHPEIGEVKLKKVIENLTDVVSSSTAIMLEGKNMTTTLSPK